MRIIFDPFEELYKLRFFVEIGIDMDSKESDICIEMESKGNDVCGNENLGSNVKYVPTALIEEALKKQQMNKEKNRIESFVNWPKPWIDIRKLARNGFYYLGRGDEIMCNFCDSGVHKFDAEDILIENQHDNTGGFFKCPLECGEETDNVPFDPIKIIRENEQKYGIEKKPQMNWKDREHIMNVLHRNAYNYCVKVMREPWIVTDKNKKIEELIKLIENNDVKIEYHKSSDC